MKAEVEVLKVKMFNEKQEDGGRIGKCCPAAIGKDYSLLFMERASALDSGTNRHPAPTPLFYFHLSIFYPRLIHIHCCTV